MLNPDNEITETATLTQETTVEMQTEKSVELIQANLHIVQEQAKELEAQALELIEKLQIARGTGDHTEQAKTARQPRQARAPRQPKEQVEAALKGVSMNIMHIAKATGLSVNKVTEAIRTLRSDQRVVNVGSEDFPQWTARIGDHASTKDLNAEIRRLIAERPMTTQELMHFTGARLSRVSGALIALQRSDMQLLNRGTARRAKWFTVDPKAVVSRLPAKA